MDYKLEDLIDIPLLQNLQNKLNLVYSFPSAIIDNEGKVLTAVAWQDICTKFHRTHSECEKECIKSDSYILEHLHEANPAVSYQCPHGLVDNATPIIIDGKHLGNFFTGQFFLEKPDLEFFRKQAKKYGFDEKEYLEAVEKVPIWTKEKLEHYLDFIKGFIEIIAGQGLSQLREIKANKLIKDNEERNRAIIQCVSDWIWEVDKEGKYCFCSENVIDVLGYSVDEMLGKSPFDFMPPDEYERLGDFFQNIVENKQSIVDLENWNIHKDGHRVCLLTNGIPTFDEHGNFSGYRGADKDITEQISVQQELIKNKQRFEGLVNLLPEAVFEMDMNFKITYVNQRALDIFGYSKSDIAKGIYALETLVPEDRERAAKIFERRFKGEEPGVVEYEAIKKNGSTFPILFHASSIIIEGKLVGSRGVIVDITERKKSEKELKDYTELFSLFMQYSPVYTFIKEVSPKESRVIQASENFGDMIGIPGSEMVGKTMEELFPPEFATKITADDWEVVKEDKIIQLDEDLNGRNYTTIKFPIVQGDKKLLAGYTIDITDKQQAENELRASEKKFKTITENSPDAIFLINKQGNYVYANQAASDMLGYTMEEILELNIKDLGVPSNKEARLSEVLRKGKIFEEMPLRKKDGTFIYVDFNAVVLPNGLLFGSCRDLTERRMAENARKESEERFNLAMKASNDGLFDWDLETNEIYYSPGWKKMLGYEDHELPNDFSTWENLTKPEDVKKSWGQHQKLIAKQIERFVIEFKMKHKKGHWVDILSRAEAIFNNDGKAIRVVGTHTNITEQKRTEEELIKAKEKAEENEAKYKELFVKMMNAFALHEMIFNEKGEPTDYRFLEVNPAWENIVGIKAEMVINKTIREIMPDIEDSWIQVYGRVVKTGISEEFEDYNKATHKYYHIYAYRPESGKFAVLFNDITIAKQAEIDLITAKEKAEESERQLKLIADNFVNGMIYQVAMLDENRRQFNYISKSVEELYGCTMQEAKEDANLIYSKLHPDDINGLIEKEKEALRNMSTFETEARAFTPDGNIRWAYYISKPRIINGIVCWDGIEVDITERKQMELELRKAKEKAEESDRLKSAFLANMSHEIRTPMNGILGFTSLLQEPNLTGEEQKKYIEIIQKSGDRMLNTVNDIIDISKIESGQMMINSSVVNVSDQLGNMYSFFKPEAEKKGNQISLKNTLSEQESIIQTDQEKLNSVLTNLIKNAIKFCEKGKIEFGCRKVENELEFYVSDTGKGIAKERQNAIFERFMQADVEDKDATQGSGLGLAISKAYLEMLGGKIWVVSEPGKGSVFYFTIPYEVQLPVNNINMESVNADESVDEFKKLNIVIAEDDPTSIMLLEIMLKPIAKSIRITSSGEETVELCLNQDIDLVLMDIQMPQMSGFEATRQIRQFNKKIIIFAQTAFALSGDREKAIEAGCNDYISKPIQKIQLFQLIDKHLFK